MNTAALLTELSTLKSKEVYFGPQGFLICQSEKELAQGQQEFGLSACSGSGSNSVTPDAETQVTAQVATQVKINHPSTDAQWVIIGKDLEIGDPYFVNLTDEQLSVYTAIPTENPWQPELVSTSLLGFLECVTLLAKQSKQSEAKVLPDNATLIDEETLLKLKDGLVELSCHADYWDRFFEHYIIWLFDDELS